MIPYCPQGIGVPHRENPKSAAGESSRSNDWLGERFRQTLIELASTLDRNIPHIDDPATRTMCETMRRKIERSLSEANGANLPRSEAE